MTAMTEAQLASKLSDALGTLHHLETFKTANQEDLSVIWFDRTATNTAKSLDAMQSAVNKIVSDNLQDLFATAVARQREAVAAARTALLDLVFGYKAHGSQAAAAVTAAHDLTQDEIARIGTVPVHEPTDGSGPIEGPTTNGVDTGDEYPF